MHKLISIQLQVLMMAKTTKKPVSLFGIKINVQEKRETHNNPPMNHVTSPWHGVRFI